MTPDVILAAYAQGIFPMAQSAQARDVDWYCPQQRGQLSIPALHVPKKLKSCIRKMHINDTPYEIVIDHDFRAVIEACAAQTDMREQTWINRDIIDVFCTLSELGYAHSVACFQNGEMVGGLYGVSLGGAFFGESMFSRVSQASKVCLVHLAARLWRCGYSVLDTQFVNDHLMQFGVYEIDYDDYIKALEQALLHKPLGFAALMETETALMASYFEMQKTLAGSP